MSDVAIVCGAGIVSGKEIMALELVAGLRDKGYILDVVTSWWGSGEFRRRCERLGFIPEVMRLGFISATLNWESVYMTTHQLFHWPGLLTTYRRFLKASQPRWVIHTTWHHLLLLSPFLQPERDLFWLHEVIPEKPQYRKLFRWLERHLYCFVAVSHAVAESLRRLGIAQEKIHVIHNGISDPTSGVATIQQPDNGFVVGIVGQIGAWKGHEDLLEAFSVVATSSPTVQLHIFGQGDSGYENILKRKAVSLGIEDRIVWRGFLAKRIQIYEEMDICVVPSRSEEPLSTVAIEAAFCGIPVIATRKGGFYEIVEHGSTGFLVDANAPIQLASRIQTLIDDQRLRDEMGKNARQVALTKFSRERFVRNFVDLLNAA